MREFILFTRGWTKQFSLNSLPNAGRMDLIARCVINAIFVSEAVRPDVKIHIVLNGPPRPPLLITFNSVKLKRVYPDERNIASHINIALKKFRFKGIESEPGIFITKKSFEELVKEKLKEKKVFFMHRNGVPIEQIDIGKDFAVIIGDNKGIPKTQEKFLDRLNVKKVSVGRVEYLDSQIITIVHHTVDKNEATG